MNEAVLHAIEEHTLTPEAVEQVVQLTERDDARDQQVALTRERKEVEKRIARFVAATDGYAFEAPTRFDKLFTGIVAPRPAFIGKGGVPGHIGAEDTFDGNYGRLLERATGNGWRARQVSNLRPPA